MGAQPGQGVRTHCVRGHERTPENVNTSGRCRICARMAALEHYRLNDGANVEYCPDCKHLKHAHDPKDAFRCYHRNAARHYDCECEGMSFRGGFAKCGHPMTDENVRLSVRSSGKVTKECRICRRWSTQRWHAKNQGYNAQWRAAHPDYDDEYNKTRRPKEEATVSE